MSSLPSIGDTSAIITLWVNVKGESIVNSLKRDECLAASTEVVKKTMKLSKTTEYVRLIMLLSNVIYLSHMSDDVTTHDIENITNNTSGLSSSIKCIDLLRMTSHMTEPRDTRHS